MRLAFLRSFAFTVGCAILAAVLAVGWAPGPDSTPIAFFALIAGGCIGWSASYGWFYRDVSPPAPGRAFEVIPEAEEKR